MSRTGLKPEDAAGDRSVHHYAEFKIKATADATWTV